MKKTLNLAAAVAALLACTAVCAQSTVTVYGKVDGGLRKAIGSEDREVATGGDSRLGFRGTEDLGGGLKAFFQIEHRFFTDTGGVDGNQFWKGISHVGLEGAWGRVGVGRQYVAAFSLVQNQIDPFGGDTVAQLRDVAMRVGGITKIRVDNSLRYDFSTDGFSAAASVAEGLGTAGNTDRHLSAAVSYRQGPWFAAAGLENPSGDEDRQWNLGLGYKLGDALLTAGYAAGTTAAGVDAKGWMLGLNWLVGSGTIKAAYGQQERDGDRFARKLGLGYHYALSKRTTLYADVGHDAEASTEKTGYDLGIIHVF
jgi:predicted porin